MFNFILDILDAVKDIWEEWRDKENKIITKIFFTIITLGFLYLSAKLWL